MSDTSLFLSCALAAYLVAAVLYVANLFVRGTLSGAVATVVAGAGALAHTAGLLLITRDTGRSPYSTFYGAAAFLSWLVAWMQIGVALRFRVPALGAISLPIAFLMLLVALVLPPEMRQVMPALRQHTMAAHISVAILGYVGFTAAFGLAVIYLMQNRLLKAKQLRGLMERLPPFRDTEELAFRFAAFGQGMLTLGIIIGSVTLAREGLAPFLRDPKVVPSLVTWSIYTIYLALRVGAGWRGRPCAYLLLAGYVAVLLTFLGVSLLYPGAHGAFLP